MLRIIVVARVGLWDMPEAWGLSKKAPFEMHTKTLCPSGKGGKKDLMRSNRNVRGIGQQQRQICVRHLRFFSAFRVPVKVTVFSYSLVELKLQQAATSCILAQRTLLCSKLFMAPQRPKQLVLREFYRVVLTCLLHKIPNPRPDTQSWKDKKARKLFSSSSRRTCVTCGMGLKRSTQNGRKGVLCDFLPNELMGK